MPFTEDDYIDLQIDEDKLEDAYQILVGDCAYLDTIYKTEEEAQAEIDNLIMEDSKIGVKFKYEIIKI